MFPGKWLIPKVYRGLKLAKKTSNNPIRNEQRTETHITPKIHTNGQQVYEEMLSIMTNEGNAYQNHH